MAAASPRIPCVMVGVGAAFDFLAGTQNEAPRWLQRIGLEWLYRLSQEPGRLWRRYLFGNASFLLATVLGVISRKVRLVVAPEHP